MSLALECAQTGARAIGIGVVATAAALPVQALLGHRSRVVRRVVWSALWIILLTPALMIGYAYSDIASLRLIHVPAARQWLYSAVLMLKLLPLAALVLRLAPRAASDSAIHCHRLWARSLPSPRRQWVTAAFWFRTDGRLAALACLSVALTAFTDHELAALMQASSWTVWLFNAQANGLLLAESLRLIVTPAAVEAMVLALLLGVVLRDAQRVAVAAGDGRQQAVASPGGTGLRGGGARVAAWGVIALALGVVTIVPLSLILSSAIPAMPQLSNAILGRDIATGLAVSLPAAVVAFLLAGLVTRPILRRGVTAIRLATLALVAAPGLLGAMVLAFVVLALFRVSVLSELYSTAAPLVVGLTLLVLPAAVVLRLALDGRVSGESLHSARLLTRTPFAGVRWTGRWLLFDLAARPRLWVLAVLVFWAYLDVAATAILQPPGLTPVSVTLYNQMHFGSGPGLSAMVLIAMAAPLLPVAAFLMFRAALNHRLRHG